MQMIEFVNHTGRIVVLTGPNKERVQLGKFERKVLPAWYSRYVPKYLRQVRKVEQKITLKKEKLTPAVANKTQPNLMQSAQDRIRKAQQREARRKHLATARQAARAASRIKSTRGGGKRIVGSTSLMGSKATQHYEEVIKKLRYPISNDIGVGILSYNRLDCLQRLIASIRKFTDLNRTTVIISDESDKKEVHDFLAGIKDMTVLQNKERIGIAGNTNRLMRCLERFNFKIILNDDVEILNSGWENIYANAMAGTGLHHFCYRQPGVYGAKDTEGTYTTINGFRVQTIMDRPQGGIIAYDYEAFKKVGYFDESFGPYGMEHVDWSNRVSLSGIQRAGYHDVVGSGNFYKIHKSVSVVPDRSKHLSRARKIFEGKKKDKSRIYIKPSDKSKVSGVTFVVPFRGADRSNAIRLVLLNIKAQRYPLIEIVMAEQDMDARHSIKSFASIKYVLAKSKEPGQPFTKAIAFNLGVSKATQDKLILHDADMIVQSDYAEIMVRKLNSYQGVHVGKSVLYLSRKSTEKVYRTARLSSDLLLDRIVGYFEGGSLGCTFNTYLQLGGFNESFIGYGCFAPGNYVLTRRGYKPIEEVSASDLLYTHEGEFRPIELRTRHYSGEILDVFVPGRLPIKGVTPEHPFLVLTGDDEWMWRKAVELKPDDEILDTDFMPELVDPYDLREVVRLDRSKNRFDLFDHLDEFCYLLGMYIAEGVLQTPDRLRTLYFFLDKEEVFLAEHIERVVKVLNDDINVTYEYVKNNCRDVRVFNSLLAKLIHAVAGKFRARQKVLSYNFLRDLSDTNIEYLLGGLCDGDANHSKGSQKRVIYHTSSINMAMIASGLMRRVGVAHSFGKRSGGSFVGSAEWGFDLCVNREFEHRLRMIYPRALLHGSSAMGRSKFGKVLEVRRRQYTGPVYNFEVKDDHSYIVNGLVVHNCEDCEFFARLASIPTFHNERSLDFVHLWHGRSTGWKTHHQRNKDIEAKLYQKPMRERILAQRGAFAEKYRLKQRI